MNEFFPIRAHGLPENSLAQERAATAITNDVVEVGGVGTDRLVRREETYQQDGWPVGRIRRWWTLVETPDSCTPSQHKDLSTLDSLEKALATVLQQATGEGMLRLRFVDRVLFLPTHRWPALRIDLTSGYDPGPGANTPAAAGGNWHARLAALERSWEDRQRRKKADEEDRAPYRDLVVEQYREREDPGPGLSR